MREAELRSQRKIWRGGEEGREEEEEEPEVVVGLGIKNQRPERREWDGVSAAKRKCGPGGRFLMP